MEDLIIEDIVSRFDNKSNAEAIKSICEDKELVTLMVGYIMGVEKLSNKRRTSNKLSDKEIKELKNLKAASDSINSIFKNNQ